MSTIEYKGFKIEQVSTNNRFYVIDMETLPASWQFGKFNPDGYSTLNTAKGAVTKHLKASESQESAFVQAVINTKTQPADAPKADVTAVAVPARTEDDNLLAQLTYHGFKMNPSDTRSRNKREGVGHVKHGGKYIRSPFSDKLYSAEPRTRKQRNEMKMAGRWLEANYTGPR